MGLLDFWYAESNSSFVAEIKDMRLAYSKDKKRFASDLFTIQTLSELEATAQGLRDATNLVLEITVGDARNYVKGKDAVIKTIKDIQNILAIEITKNSHLFKLDIYLPNISHAAFGTECDIESLENIMDTVDGGFAFNIKPIKFLSSAGRYEYLYGMEEMTGCDKASIEKMIRRSKPNPKDL